MLGGVEAEMSGISSHASAQAAVARHRSKIGDKTPDPSLTFWRLDVHGLGAGPVGLWQWPLPGP